MHGRSSTGSHMGEILNELFNQGPDIIGKPLKARCGSLL